MGYHISHLEFLKPQWKFCSTNLGTYLIHQFILETFWINGIADWLPCFIKQARKLTQAYIGLLPVFLYISQSSSSFHNKSPIVPKNHQIGIPFWGPRSNQPFTINSISKRLNLWHDKKMTLVWLQLCAQIATGQNKWINVINLPGSCVVVDILAVLYPLL